MTLNFRRCYLLLKKDWEEDIPWATSEYLCLDLGLVVSLIVLMVEGCKEYVNYLGGLLVHVVHQ